MLTFHANSNIFGSSNVAGEPDNGIDFSNVSVEFIPAIADEIMLGDVNCDDAVDFLDIAPFIAILASGDFLDKADIVGSSVVDFLDIAPLIAILSGS